MGQSSSKSNKCKGGVASQPAAQEVTVVAVPERKESLQIEAPERKSEWDDKSKWDDRSGLRAFCIVHHEQYGFLLLQAEKRKKGLHYQLSGGHVDQNEINSMSVEDKTSSWICRLRLCDRVSVRGEATLHYKSYAALGPKPASQVACARELFEETGIDLRNHLDRLELCEVAPGRASLKGRVFYWINISQADSLNGQGRLTKAARGEDFQIRLSGEHIGFVFENSYRKAADMLIWHSGGKCSDALLRICDIRNHQAPETG